MTGRSDSVFFKLVAMLLKTLVKHVWSCGEFLASVGRLLPDHCQNQTHARLSARRDNGAEMTRGELTATY